MLEQLNSPLSGFKRRNSFKLLRELIFVNEEIFVVGAGGRRENRCIWKSGVRSCIRSFLTCDSSADGGIVKAEGVGDGLH